MKKWFNKRSVLIALFSFAIFANTTLNDYNLDDELVSRGHKITAANSKASFTDLFTTPYEVLNIKKNHGFRPLTLASFYFEHRLFGESAFISHLINVILYSILCFCLYLLLIRLFSSYSDDLLLLICMLFACLPIHTEVVASIKNRDEIQALLFLLFALLFTIVWIHKKKVVLLPLIVCFLSASLLSKLTTLPILLITPIILSLKYPLNHKRYLLLSATFSIPLVFSFFIVSPLLALALPFLSLVCFMTFFFLNKKLQPMDLNAGASSVLFILIPASSTILSLYFQDKLLLLLSLSLFGIASISRLPVFVILSSLLSIAGFVLLNKSFFLYYALFLLVFQLKDFTLKDEVQKVYLAIGVLALVVLFGLKKDPIDGLAVLSPLAVVLTYKLHKYAPLGISLLGIVIALIFGFFKFIILAQLLVSISLIIKTKQAKKVGSIALIIALLVAGLYELSGSNGLNFSNLNQNTEVSANSNFGRELAFVENPLIDEHQTDERIKAGVYALTKYTWLMALPVDLNFYYGYAEISLDKIQILELVLWSILLILLFKLAWRNKKNNPLLLVGLAWFIIALLPFSNLFYLVAGFIGERLAFTASIGFCLLVGGLLHQAKPDFRFSYFKLPQIIVILLLIVFSIKTIDRNTYWKDHLTLMKHDIKQINQSAHAHYLLAINGLKSLTSSSNSKETSQTLALAEKHLKKSIEIYDGLDTYHQELGKVYLAKNELEKAESSFKKAIKLEPNSIIANKELIKISFSLKKHEQVLKYGEYYLKRDPNQSLIFEMVAFSAFYLNDTQKAINYAKIGLQYFPNNKNLKELIYRLER